MRKKNSILFVRPDYHCSFFYRDEFRRLGWKADIFLNFGYPKQLLYSKDDILQAPQLPFVKIKLIRGINYVVLLLYWLAHFWRYEYHIYYGKPPLFKFMERILGLTKLFGKDFLVELWLSKLFGIKLVYLPTGCNEEESKKNMTSSDNGHLCGNCGQWDKCNDTVNNLNFTYIKRFFDMQIGAGFIDSTQYQMTHMKYKSIDLALWHPDLTVPDQHRLPVTNKIRILHSNYLKKSGRDGENRNEKGSPYIVAAIERLKTEGHPVEYYFIENKPSNEMRFYQVQADIVVEQLIYGWWGSTGVETMALGKPVVCYLRPDWKEYFQKVVFPEYDNLPIVEASINSIYDVLKKLVINTDYRRRKGEEARRYAEAHFDPVKNTKAFSQLLKSL
jgi:glycosyltransferase involved in cell wall biosynthesis